MDNQADGRRTDAPVSWEQPEHEQIGSVFFYDGYVEFRTAGADELRRRKRRVIAALLCLMLGATAVAAGLYSQFEQPVETAPIEDTPANIVPFDIPRHFLNNANNAQGILPTRDSVRGFAIIKSMTQERGELGLSDLYERCLPSVAIVYSERNIGTGVIISADGTILTCAHILDNGTKVQLSDGRAFTPVLVARDKTSDIAVLKITADALSPAEFASVGTVRVGDTLPVIGNPVNGTITLTRGILSGISNDMLVNGYPMQVIMTDAIIESGHSGAPMYNMYGQVIGIVNGSFGSNATTRRSVSFALPAEYVKSVVDDLLMYGYVQGRVTLGVSVGDLASGYATFVGAPAGAAVTAVDEVDDDGGLRAGDIITAINDTEITSANDYIRVLATHPVGTRVTLTVWRNGREYTHNIDILEQHE